MSQKDVPTDSLASLDEFGDRNYLFPAEVKGFFKRLRNWVHPIFIFIFLVLPWIKINGEQSILLNIPKREFNFFGLHLFAHDAPIIFFVLAGLLIGLSLVTAVWGRVWCGWACPQTVFIEGVFRQIERLLEGNHVQRRKLFNAPMTPKKFFIKSLKWLMFLLVSLIITHSFLAYFVGAEDLVKMVQSSPKENWTPFLIIVVTTAIILFDFGWFREQFCLIMCPYGRFQSVLFDSHSMAVLYDEKRGEPRKGSEVLKGNPQTPQGDCVNCFKCVTACPTGIDIRNGLQMECIACTACIDACDEIMEKVNKPKGLIRYATLKELEGGKNQHFRPRTITYAVLLVAILSGLVFSLGRRNPFHISVIRAIESPYKILDIGNGKEDILNHFKLNLKNQTSKPMTISYEIEKQPENLKMIAPINPAMLQPGELKRAHIFLERPKEDFLQHKEELIVLKFSVKGLGEEISHTETLSFVGPDR